MKNKYLPIETSHFIVVGWKEPRQGIQTLRRQLPANLSERRIRTQAKSRSTSFWWYLALDIFRVELAAFFYVVDAGGVEYLLLIHRLCG